MEMVSIRASSLPELFDCPARWEAKQLHGLRLPRSAAAQIGTAIHASTAVFDIAVFNDNPITADDAAGAAVDAIYRPIEVVEWDDVNPATAEKIAISLHKKYCAEIAPMQDYVGVEITCEQLDITDLGISLTGTTDRVRRTKDGRLGIVDIKTGTTAVNAAGKVKTSGHGNQLAVYDLLTSFALGITLDAPAQIVGMQTGKTNVAQRVAVEDVDLSSCTLVGSEGTTGLLEIASRIVHLGLFYGNPRSQICGEKYCPIYKTCRFRG